MKALSIPVYAAQFDDFVVEASSSMVFVSTFTSTEHKTAFGSSAIKRSFGDVTIPTTPVPFDVANS